VRDSRGAGPPGRLPPLTTDQYRRITGVVIAAIGLIIVTGSAVRLTGSGLGCTEWPTCEQGRVVAPLETHALIEFGNRVVSGLIAIPVLAAFVGSFALLPRRRDLTAWSALLVAGVGVNAVLGGILVKVELAPGFTTAHFLLSMALVWNALVLHHRAGRPAGTLPASADPATVRFSRLMVAASMVVLVTGTLVTGTGPHAGDERAHRYDFATVTDVARVHSLAAWAFLLITLLLLWRVARTGATYADPAGRRLVGAIVFQGALGYAQYASDVPPYLVIVHIAGSVLVFIATLDLHLSLCAGGPERAEAAAVSTPTPTVAGR
jgi:heme a synthase